MQPEILSTSNLSALMQHPLEQSEEKQSFVAAHSRNPSAASVGKRLSNSSSFKR